MTQNLLVLGATGSVGRSTLDVAARHPTKLTVWGLSVHRDITGLVALCLRHQPTHAVIADAACYGAAKAAFQDVGITSQLHAGPESLDALAAHSEVDQVMAAIAGSPGLASTRAAIRAGKRVLIANKEPLVLAGPLLMREAAASGATILPIDSEHNAIFQCLPAGSRCGMPLAAGIRRLILTASGGPFWQTPLAELQAVTPEQAVRHPNWSMGRKISVDSASMFNKALELIEASVLYGLPHQQIDVVIHPESIIHSMVEYVDGSTLAQLGCPDMRTPIAHALAWPDRWEAGVAHLDWTRTSQLRFYPMDDQRFPAIGLARACLERGGHAPAVLNAANEVAVAAFLDGKLGFLRIAELVTRVLDAAGTADLPQSDELIDALAVDDWARRTAAAHIMLLGA